MLKTTTAPVSSRTNYQRPYKTRQQRREKDRRKTDESSDYRFLVRIGIGIAIMLLLMVGFALKGMIGTEAAPASSVESLQ